MSIESRRFVTAAEKVDYISPWTLEEWLCRSDVVPNKELLMVRANMEAGCQLAGTHGCGSLADELDQRVQGFEGARRESVR